MFSIPFVCIIILFVYEPYANKRTQNLVRAIHGSPAIATAAPRTEAADRSTPPLWVRGQVVRAVLTLKYHSHSDIPHSTYTPAMKRSVHGNCFTSDRLNTGATRAPPGPCETVFCDCTRRSGRESARGTADCGPTEERPATTSGGPPAAFAPATPPGGGDRRRTHPRPEVLCGTMGDAPPAATPRPPDLLRTPE